MFLFLLVVKHFGSFDCNSEHCTKCTYYDNECAECEEGYFVGNDKCEKCHSTCKTCNNQYEAQCYECKDGYYLKKTQSSCYYNCVGKCMPCSDDGLCSKCSSTSPYTCTDCFEHNYLYKEVTPNKCKPCHESCDSCSGPSETECITCKQGYFKEDNLCKKCGDGCSNCDNESKCNTCDDHFFLNSTSQCQECDHSCKSCHGLTMSDCDECFEGYYDSNGLCRSCDPNCKNCAGARNLCTECHDGTFLNEERHLCQDCDVSCKTCNNPSDCLSCADGYYSKNSKNQCLPCSDGDHCATCVYSSSKVYCLSCEPGYYKGTSWSGPTGSVTCSKNNMNGCYIQESYSKCTQCFEGFYLDSYNRCQSCSANCSLCTNGTVCLACSNGFFLDKETSTCVKCSPNCIECESAASCSICADNYYINKDGFCDQCDASCHRCRDGTNACIDCAKGYYFNEFKRCVKCGDNCDVCTDATHCTDCATEFFVLNDGSCYPCAEVCFECTGPTSDDCIECDPGFYLSSSLKQCFRCHDACSNCTGPNDNQCSQCSPGYHMYEGQCIQCEYGCKSCTSTIKCVECNEGFYLTNSDCKPCEGGCKNCTLGADKCTECAEGYYEESKDGDFVNCSACPYDCKVCSKSQSGDVLCSLCNDGYYLNGKFCSKCNSPCATCSSADVCTSCINGHLLEGSSCNSLCSSPCTTCENTPSTCTSCDDGYMLNGSTCLQCSSNCKTCEIGINPSYCTSCFDGFYLVDEECLPCTKACATCLDGFNSDCYTCPDGYYKFNQKSDFTGRCDTCESEDKYCTKCTSDCSSSTICDFICLECKFGYYLKDGKCTSCDSSCKTCDGPTDQNCLTCIDEYFIENGKCSKCDSSCLTCDTVSTKCTSCKSHQYLTNDGKCLECNDNCTQCKDADTCTECPQYQFMHEGKCLKSCLQLGEGWGANSNFECERCNLDHCIQYDDSCQCTLCSEGYFIVTDSITLIEVCVPCQLDNCKACNGPEINDCTECNSGYELQTDSATRNKVCVSDCEEGYFVNISNQCEKCHFPCRVCSGYDGSVCSDCEDGYYFDGEKCGFFPNNCEIFKHCENENKGEQAVQIVLETTKFDSFRSEKSGGALRLINCGVTGEGINFNDCRSEKGGGGAIYIFNEKNNDYSITLNGATFSNCKAAFGGAVYIYSVAENSPVLIQSCNFINNDIIQPTEENIKKDFVGGSSLYLTIKNGSVNDCHFKLTNKSSYVIIKSSDKFDIKPESSSLQLLHNNDNLLQNMKSFQITECSFEVDDSSLVYVVESQNQFHVESDFIKSKDYKYSDAIKSELNSRYITFDLNNLNDKVDDKRKIVINLNKSSKLMITASSFGLVAIIASILAFKKKSYEEQSSKINNDSIDSLNA